MKSRGRSQIFYEAVYHKNNNKGKWKTTKIKTVIQFMSTHGKVLSNSYFS